MHPILFLSLCPWLLRPVFAIRYKPSNLYFSPSILTLLWSHYFSFVLQLRVENNIHKSSVMVTAGANQVTMPAHYSSFFFGVGLLKDEYKSHNFFHSIKTKYRLSVCNLYVLVQNFSTSLTNLTQVPFWLQAFVNLVLTLCDAGDSVVMFAPYYFNAYMSFQMTGVTKILVGPGNSKTLHPDAG